MEKGSQGFSAKPIQNKMGIYSSDTAAIFLDECEVPKENMLGPPGKGLSVAYSALMSGRLSVAAGCVGVIRDCLDEAVRYSGVRVQHGKLIGKHQLVQRHIGIMAVNLEAARLLTLNAPSSARDIRTIQGTSPSGRGRRVDCQGQVLRANASFDAAPRRPGLRGERVLAGEPAAIR